MGKVFIRFLIAKVCPGLLQFAQMACDAGKESAQGAGKCSVFLLVNATSKKSFLAGGYWRAGYLMAWQSSEQASHFDQIHW